MNMPINHPARLIGTLLLSLVLAACGGNGQQMDGEARRIPSPASSQVEATTTPGSRVITGTTVNVVAQDFEFVMDTTTVNAGTITFVVTNRGTMPHDFAIKVGGETVKTPMLNRGENASISIELKPGTYDYICTVPGHDMLGMRGKLSVL